MINRASGTMARADKGAIAPPPEMTGSLAVVASAVTAWDGVIATSHWHLTDRSSVDGIDFYVGQEELGHVHLDGSIHLATNASLGRALVDEGSARPFRYQAGWVCADVETIGAARAIALFRRNYDALLG